MIEVALQLTDDIASPQYASTHAAGCDLVANNMEPIILKPFERGLIPTGIKMAIPPGFEGQVRPRSGLALKNGVTVLNAPGTVDADYRGEIKIILINFGQEDFVITRGMRIAQLVVARVEKAAFHVVDDLSITTRGESGFGSTGVN